METRWLVSAREGYCETTDGPGNCSVDVAGAVRLSRSNSTSMHTAVSACIDFCNACAQCKFISVSQAHRDCSWFLMCDLDDLQKSVSGFVSGPVRRSSRRRAEGAAAELTKTVLWVAIGVILRPNASLSD